MASYNGERFIFDQLASILSQLSPLDEVIIVDDCSTDHTRDRIMEIKDERIRLIVHEVNLGVMRTFEDAIRNASRSILFLSDQDDLWAPTKVDTIVRAFVTHPDVMLVASDAALIDEQGTLLASSYFSPRGGFSAGFWKNLARNRYGGCTLAFRTDFCREILPFPHGYDILHDMWIGLRCAVSFSRALYIDQPLVLNRRHGTTATGIRKLSLARKVRIRLHLLAALTTFSLRGRGPKSPT
jgi:glycosyltransferase involved in cell wall biosynthesis